jgi:hypothetical protein
MMPFIVPAGYHRPTVPTSTRDDQNPDRLGLLRLIKDGFEIRHGHPLPLGATLQRGGINFALFSRHATR